MLPLNIINEKIYIFLWFWFILLASITGMFLLYRLGVLFGAGIRTAMIQARSGRVPRDKISDILNEPGLNYFQQLGDFFLLYLIAKNMDEVGMKVRGKKSVLVSKTQSARLLNVRQAHPQPMTRVMIIGECGAWQIQYHI